MDSSSDVAAISRHRDAYNGALKAGDVEGWLATLTDDCVFLPPGVPAVVGKDAVRTWSTESIFSDFNVDLEYDFDELEFQGPSAMAWGWFKQTLAPKAGGEAIVMKGKFLDVFKKAGDGEWKLARCAYSPDHE